MSKQVIIHAVVEMLIVSSITVFLNRRIKASEDTIRGLKKQVDNLQTTINTMSKHMDHIYGILETLPIPPPAFRQPMRTRMMPPPPPMPQQQPVLHPQQQEVEQPQMQQQMMQAGPPMDFGMSMIGGLLSAMMPSGGAPAAVMRVTTLNGSSVPAGSPVQITEETDDDHPALLEALDELGVLDEVKEETQGLKADELPQVDAQ